MNLSQIKTQTVAVYESIDWKDVAYRTEQGLLLVWFALQLTAMVVTILAEIAYEHREQIRNSAVKVVAFVVVAAQLTYEAGVRTRTFAEALSDRSATLVASQPLATLAPITAPLQASREALARFLALAGLD